MCYTPHLSSAPSIHTLAKLKYIHIGTSKHYTSMHLTHLLHRLDESFKHDKIKQKCTARGVLKQLHLENKHEKSVLK